MSAQEPTSYQSGAGRPPIPADARRLLAAIVESSDDAILSKALDGTITSWNRGAEQIYGYSAAEAIGHHISMLVPPDVENDIPKLMARLHRGERIDHYETVRLARDGRRLNVSLTISPLRDESGQIVGASTIARDITDRNLASSRWRLLSDVEQALAQVLDPDELLRELARVLVREISDYSVTYILEGDRIRRVGAAHTEAVGEALVHRLIELRPPTLSDAVGAGAVIRTGEAILAPEIDPAMLEQIAASGEYLSVIRALDPRSSIVLPMRARGRTVGAVAIAATSRSGRRYTDADLTLLRAVADRAGLALDNARLYAEVRAELSRREAAEASLRRRYDQLRVLYEMSESVGRAEDVGEIYDRALDGLARGVGIERASVLLFDPDGIMRFKAWRGLSDGYRQAVEGHAPWTPDSPDPHPILIPDVTRDSDLDDELRQTILAEGIRGMAFIPLTFGGRVLGKFMLYSDVPRSLDDEDVELAKTIAGTIAVAITRKRDEQAIREAKETAESANQAKSQFLGVMSHELRTPLNAVLGYSEILLLGIKGEVTPVQKEHLERIQISARHQLDLVDELLAYTRLEAGREEPRLLESDARRVIADVAELVRPEIEMKGLELILDLPDRQLPVVTDPAKLRQIVLNLTANAVKYTDAGSVSIRLRKRGAKLVVEVRDTGPGIPVDKLEYIFEPFARVDETLTRHTAGTGLGLAIARRLAEMLHGELRVRSRVERGSTFILELPATHPTTRNEPEISP
jgi:PAS domain S-box-containing protein